MTTAEENDDSWHNLIRDLNDVESRDAASLFADAARFLGHYHDDPDFAEKHPEATATMALTAAVCWLCRSR